MRVLDALILIVKAHPILSIAVVLFISQSASAMPSPTITGKYSGGGYKWFFGTMQANFALCRVPP